MKLFRKPKTFYREDGAAYMRRWTLFTCKYFSIKVHKIMLSDYDCMHDHPWAFCSLILRGGYVEKTEAGSKILHPGNFLFRPALHRHKLEIHQTCWTLVLMFRKVRVWGFWTKAGFVPWFKYNSTNSCDV